MSDFVRTVSKRIVWYAIKTRIFKKVRPRICHTPIFQLKGQTKGSKQNLSAIVFANKEVAHYFSKISFDGEPELKNLGKITYHEISSTIASIKPDIAFADTSLIFSQFLQAQNFLILPYIDFILDLSKPLDSIFEKMSRDKRRIVQRVKELGYLYQITDDYQKLKLFYYDMYLPHTLNRHKKSAEIVSFSESKRFFQEGGLLLTKLDGKYVSGIIYVSHGKELYSPMGGMIDTEKYLAKDAASAPLCFLIPWAKKQGYEKIDYGSSTPFLKDGVFTYKRDWGMGIRPMKGSDAQIYAIKICKWNNATIEFLQYNPFIFFDSEKLIGLTLCDSSTRHIERAYCIPGLSGLVIFHPAQNPPNLEISQIQSLFISRDCEVLSPLNFLVRLARESGYEAGNVNF